MDLIDAKEKPPESLRHYLERISSELNHIQNSDNLIASGAFRDGLIRNQEFYKIFVRKPPMSMVEIIAKTKVVFEWRKQGLAGTKQED